MSASPSEEQLKTADETTAALDTMNDTQHSRMPSPTPQAAQSPSTATETPAQPAETPPHSSHQHATSSQPALNSKAPWEPSIRNSSPAQPSPSSKASKTTSLLTLSNNMAETQKHTNSQTINKTHSSDQPPEPQPQQPDPVDSSGPLEDHNWDDLEARFRSKMEECDRVEQGNEAEFKELLSFFKLWTQTGSVHEEERASKRLRTRMAFVQRSEKTLQEKQKHYTKVVQAFESALALLAD